jgi:hypothetical protein
MPGSGKRPRYGVGRLGLKGQTGLHEEHHSAETTEPLSEHAAICAVELEMPTLSEWRS